MNNQMEFPDTWEEYEKEYGFEDKEQVYTNGSRLISCSRVKQWLDYKEKVIDDIRTEIEEQKIIIHSKAFESEYKIPMLNGQLSGISKALDIINKYIGGKNDN